MGGVYAKHTQNGRHLKNPKIRDKCMVVSPPMPDGVIDPIKHLSGLKNQVNPANVYIELKNKINPESICIMIMESHWCL